MKRTAVFEFSETCFMYTAEQKPTPVTRQIELRFAGIPPTLAIIQFAISAGDTADQLITLASDKTLVWLVVSRGHAATDTPHLFLFLGEMRISSNHNVQPTSLYTHQCCLQCVHV